MTTASAWTMSSTSLANGVALVSGDSMRSLRRTQSTITELLDHAQQHVHLSTIGSSTHTAFDTNWPVESASDTAPPKSKRSAIERLLLRKKHQVVRLAERKPSQDTRYQRLHQSFSGLCKHLLDTAATRVRVEEALMVFRDRAKAMEAVLPPEPPRDSRLMVTSMASCFAHSAVAVDDLVHVLAHDISQLTDAKIDQLEGFKEHLDRRKQLQIDCDIAKAQLDQFERLGLKQRSTVPGAYELELAQRDHEYQKLRHRLQDMSAAIEHVLQFHTQLDDMIVAPELIQTHRQLTRFFEKHARVFENNVQ